MVREGLGTLLGLIAGIEVVGTATDGNEALALAIKLRPDVVLMDLRMPRCDGIEATRRLREHDASIKGACSPPTPMTGPSSTRCEPVPAAT